MTTRAQERWLTSAPGKAFNPDNAYGLQCKDVADAYCIEIFGDWVSTIRPGDGKDVVGRANSTHFDKFFRDWNEPDYKPMRGDIVSWGASRLVPEGHVAVVLDATATHVTVVEQDGYAQRPATVSTHGYVLPNGARCIGWLRPKLNPDVPEKEKIVMIDKNGLEVLYRFYLGQEISQYGLDHRLGKQTFSEAQADIVNSEQYKERIARYTATQGGAVNHLPRALRDVMKLPEQVTSTGGAS